ncbi:MAG: hypothetical protein ACFFBD_24045, partial [Candidatus Hodarchaeota archaeon]
ISAKTKMRLILLLMISYLFSTSKLTQLILTAPIHWGLFNSTGYRLTCKKYLKYCERENMIYNSQVIYLKASF